MKSPPQFLRGAATSPGWKGSPTARGTPIQVGGTPRASPGGSAVKAKQSQLKQLVQSFGKLILSWQGDVGFMHELLEALERTQRSLDCLQRCTMDNQSQARSLFSRFPETTQRLTALLIKDMEVYCNALRQHMHGLGDVFAAMQFAANDLFSVALGERHDALGNEDESAIFSVEHVLEVQRLQSQFSLEYQRKQGLLDALIGGVLLGSELGLGPGSRALHEQQQQKEGRSRGDGSLNALLPRGALEACLQGWQDGTSAAIGATERGICSSSGSGSFLDGDMVRAFIVQNGIGGGDSK